MGGKASCSAVRGMLPCSSSASPLYCAAFGCAQRRSRVSPWLLAILVLPLRSMLSSSGQYSQPLRAVLCLSGLNARLSTILCHPLSQWPKSCANRSILCAQQRTRKIFFHAQGGCMLADK